MRICVLVHQFPVRSETFVIDQVDGLRNRGHEVVVVPLTPRPSFEWDPPANVRALVDATAPRPGPPPAGGLGRAATTATLVLRGALRGGRTLRFARDKTVAPPSGFGRRLLLAERVAAGGPFDAMHAQFGTTASAAVGLRRHGITDARVVCSIHGQDANVTAQANPERFAHIMQGVDVVTAGTGYMRDVVTNLGVPVDKVRLWPQGVDLARCAPSTRSNDAAFRVLSVGRLVEFKGVDDNLRVIAAARDSIPGLAYTVVGDGPLRPHLEALSRDLGVDDITTFAGGRDHEAVLASFAANDVLLHMGKVGADGSREGQGVALIEAAASEVACIATRVGGIPEVVIDGETGRLVGIGDVAAAADVLVRLARDPAARRQLGAAARRHAESVFSLPASVLALEEILKG